MKLGPSPALAERETGEFKEGGHFSAHGRPNLDPNPNPDIKSILAVLVFRGALPIAEVFEEAPRVTVSAGDSSKGPRIGQVPVYTFA